MRARAGSSAVAASSAAVRAVGFWDLTPPFKPSSFLLALLYTYTCRFRGGEECSERDAYNVRKVESGGGVFGFLAVG